MEQGRELARRLCPSQRAPRMNASGAGAGNGSAGPLRLPTFSPAAQARVGITLALFTLAAGGNAAVLRAAGGRRRGRRSHVRVLLAHLAAADLLVAVVVMPLDAGWNVTVQWYAGDLACRALMFLKLLAMYASAFVTVVISLDRQAAILRPLAIARARRHNQLLLYGAWLLSATLAAPQVPAPAPSTRSRPRVGFTRPPGCIWARGQEMPASSARRAWLPTPCTRPCVRPEGQGVGWAPAWGYRRVRLQLFLFRTVTVRAAQNFTQCTTHGSFPRRWHEILYNMLSFAGLFLLPLLIMVTCYARILLEISRRAGTSLCECRGPGDGVGGCPEPRRVLRSGEGGSVAPSRGCQSKGCTPRATAPGWSLCPGSAAFAGCPRAPVQAVPRSRLPTSAVAVSSKEAPLRRSRNNIPRARLRMLRLSLAIVGSFVLCWTPYYLLGLWYWFCPRTMERHVPPSLAHLLFIFGLLNACLDPLTYGLFTLPLRHRPRCCWPCGHRPPPGAEPTSPATGSFRCSASSIQARRGAPGTRHEAPDAPADLGPRAGSFHSSSL